MLVRCIVVCVICALIVAVSANEELTDETLIQDLIQWVIAKGGVFNRKMEIRRSNPRDPNSHLAMFAQDDIPENELLLEIPRSVLITAGDDKGEYGGLWCPTVRNLIAELKKGDESEFAPYVKYLKRQPPGQLPSAWSDAGKDLLLELLAQNDDDDFNDVRPADAIGWIDNEWKQDCQGSDDAFEQHVAMLLVQRGWDDLAIPLFDMMSHRNGRWHNTKSNSVHKKSTNIKVKASRDIKAGEEIYSSYNFCKDCANKAKGEYGTPEILRDYGFVENYPQRWFFGRRLSFEIDQIYDEDDMPTGEFTINWLDKKPKKKAIRWLVKTLDRLNDFEAMELESVDKDIPPGELTVIKAFHKALMNAIQMALKHWKVEIQQLSGDCKEGDDSCALSARYDDLGWRPDDLGYAVYTCDTSVSMSYKGFEKLESFKSHYQKVDFWKDPKNDNVCLDISNIIQMCGSYRPHYHEMVVHYPARYIDTIKRVLWVGGGDSMLLHEILKYPSLEFVVGLELDQTITRYSFKHFGTQPHFDNEKVQWWYGDAAKSLLLLPADYFGSFDMVLVDLSETVMSFLVTDKLDIMQALSLLIKPDGIMVKNELYMEQMAEIFDYSLQIHYPGVPVICSQCLILGSNKIDFLYDDLKDHKLDNIYIQDLEKIEDRWEYFHDYRRNDTAVHLCREDDEPEPEPEEQTRSPGILMIIEAEDATIDLTNPENILKTVNPALEEVGLRVKTTTSFKGNKGVTAVVTLKEGYVMFRTWPEHKYCAVDLHLWNAFDIQDAAKKAIIKALGSPGGKSSSSYRIVAGGMFGLDSWKEDEMKRGPRVVDKCEEEEDVPRPAIMDKKIAEALLQESLRVIQDNDFTVAVICGEQKDGCKSLDIADKHKEAKKVVPLWSCPEISNEFKEGAFERMIACEKEKYAYLQEAVPNDKKIRAIIIDPTATHSFTRIVYKLLKAKKNRLLTKELFGFGVIFDENDAWRRNVMERFRKDIITDDPNFRSEIFFNNTDSSVEMDIMSSGDEGYVHRLMDVVSSVEKKTGLVSDVRDIKGGLYVKDPNWQWSHFFLPEDYDQAGPLEQWRSQQPVGYQTVVQLEKHENKKVDLDSESIKAAIKDSLSKMESVSWEESKEMDMAEIQVSSGVGDGCVITALWASGSCIALWDGRAHLDLNLFTNAESEEAANEFVTLFKGHFPKKSLTTALRDSQPRGFGRVVNFLEDIQPRRDPHWAKFKETATT